MISRLDQDTLSGCLTGSDMGAKNLLGTREPTLWPSLRSCHRAPDCRHTKRDQDIYHRTAQDKEPTEWTERASQSLANGGKDLTKRVSESQPVPLAAQQDRARDAHDKPGSLPDGQFGVPRLRAPGEPRGENPDGHAKDEPQPGPAYCRGQMPGPFSTVRRNHSWCLTSAITGGSTVLNVRRPLQPVVRQGAHAWNHHAPYDAAFSATTCRAGAPSLT